MNADDRLAAQILARRILADPGGHTEAEVKLARELLQLVEEAIGAAAELERRESHRRYQDSVIRKLLRRLRLNQPDEREP